MIAVELEQRFRYVPFAPKDYSARSEDLDNLFHAVADLRPLVLCYPATSGDGLARVTIHPYGLVLYKEAIFAIAHDVATGDIRTFDLEHVRDTRCLEDQRFVLPEDFCVDDYAQGQFGLWRTSGPTIATVIDFDARVARELQSRRFHRSQRFELLADGNLRMHLELGDTRELAAWIMGFGPLAVVREPSALREEIERSLAAALAHYRAAPTRPKEL